MCELQYKFSFSLVCQLEAYFGLVQDCFGLVQGCFGCFSSVQGCFSCSRLLQFGSVWFKIPSVWFSSRLLQQFKVAPVWFSLVQDSFSLVQGCFSGSRCLDQCMVMSVVQGGIFSLFQEGYLFLFKNYLVQLKVASTVQGHVHWQLVQFLWFYLVQGCFTSNTHVGAVQGRQPRTSLLVGWELYFGASVTSEGSLEFYGCFYEYGFSNLLQLGDCKSTAFHCVWPPQEVFHETTPIMSREPMRG
jgi:hypothetical protein